VGLPRTLLDHGTAFVFAAYRAERAVERKIAELEAKQNADDLDWEDARAQLPLEALRRRHENEKARQHGIEDKAKKNLTALAVAAGVTTAGIGLMAGRESSQLFHNAVGLAAGSALLAGSTFFIVGVLTALRALTIAKTYDLTLEDETRGKGAQASLLVSCIDLNQLRTTIRTNWVYASDACIRNALVALVLFAALAIGSVAFMRPGGDQRGGPLSERAPGASERTEPIQVMATPTQVVSQPTEVASPTPSDASQARSMRIGSSVRLKG
jgi:hypothetical protein